MQEDDKPKNLFDTVSDVEGKKRRLKKRKKRRPLPVGSESTTKIRKTERPAEAKPSVTVEEDPLAEMFTKMKQMREDLETKMLDLYAKVGVSRKMAEQFFSDPNNISPEIGQGIDNDIKKLEGKLKEALGENAVKAAKVMKTKKEATQDVVKRKKKTVGQRRKWLKM